MRPVFRRAEQRESSALSAPTQTLIVADWSASDTYLDPTSVPFRPKWRATVLTSMAKPSRGGKELEFSPSVYRHEGV